MPFVGPTVIARQGLAPAFTDTLSARPEIISVLSDASPRCNKGFSYLNFDGCAH